MKKHIFKLGVFAAVLFCNPVMGQGNWGSALQGALQGAASTVEKSGVKEKTKELLGRSSVGGVTPAAGMTKVAAALEKSGYVTDAKAKPAARYYIFICSASWCPPCRALMPKIVDEYKKNMRRDDSVSLILLGGDSSPEGCKKYLSHYGAKFPALMNSQTIELPERPNTKYWPFAFIMDADGKLITSGHGSLVLDWKNQIQKAGK